MNSVSQAVSKRGGGAQTASLSSSVLTVGGGRGFVVEIPRNYPAHEGAERVIVTAAHCLPELPPAGPHTHGWERTYSKLVGMLGKYPTTSVECYFVDPVADVAVLGSPDVQELFEEADAYDELVGRATPLSIADLRPGRSALVLSLNGEWFQCDVSAPGGSSLLLEKAAQPITFGMSGSPIVQHGSAVGVVCVSSRGDSRTERYRGGGPNPRLLRDLPARMLPASRRETSR